MPNLPTKFHENQLTIFQVTFSQMGKPTNWPTENIVTP